MEDAGKAMYNHAAWRGQLMPVMNIYDASEATYNGQAK
jgi:hypothetical protein